MVGFGFAGSAALPFAAAAGFAAAALAGTALRAATLATGAGLADFPEAAATGFLAGFAATFVLTAAFFTAGFDGDLRAVAAVARTTCLPFAGAFTVFARLTGFAVLFAIPKPIL